MLAISTNNIGMMDITSSNSKVKSKEDDKVVDTFASLMNMTSMNDGKTDVSNDIVSNVSDGSVNRKDDVVSYETIKQNNSDSANKYSSSKNEQTTKVSSKKNEVDKTVDDAACENIVSGIKTILSEKLNLSDEEIETLVEESGMTFADLLNPDNLKQLVLTAENSTEVDLLVNENLANLLEDVTNAIDTLVNGLFGDADFDISELIPAFKEILEKNVSDDALVENEEPIAELKFDVKTENTTSEEVTETTKNTDNIVSQINVSEDANSGNKDGSLKKDFDSQASQVVNNLNDAINQVSDDTMVADFDSNVQEADIVRQLIDDIKVNITKDETSLQLQLNPENLGKVHISVAQKNGVMQAQIVAETEAAKKAIENNIQVLKEAFDNKELKVEAVEVTIASYEFFGDSSANEQEQQNTSARTNQGTNITLNDSFDETGLSEDETLQVEMMKNTGNSVNYQV